MPSEVTVPYSKMETLKSEIEDWLTKNSGTGSARFGGRAGEIRHWLNGDNWLYYNQWITGDLEDHGHVDTVFVFRDERVATEFALRFA